MTEARRADLLLVERGLFPSRTRARAAIEAGLVKANGRPVGKPSETIPPGAAIEAEAPHPYVSRGGVKLAYALDRAGIDPTGRICLDIGASTGGFSDVLLRRGAARIYAVDVGHGQLHPDIAKDPRIVSLERQDARTLGPHLVPEPVGLVTIDVSFISLRLVMPNLVPFLGTGAHLVALIKPQFEVGRAGIGRGGLVRGEALAQAAVDRIVALAGELGLVDLRLDPSPITGRDGNREVLLSGRHG